MRPGTLEEIVGQDDLIAPGSALRSAFDRNRLASMILWGPPGSGQTTLARLIARTAGLRFVAFSAVLSGIKEVKEVMAAAEREHRGDGRPTLLFVDEIHRFNRAQQDAFLPHVEQGTILLIGATTENPSFAVNAALLSRCSVQVLQPLSEEHLVSLLRRALSDPRGLREQGLAVGDEELRLMATRAGGDARRALNALESLSLIVAGRIVSAEGHGPTPVTRQDVDRALARAALLYDKSGEEHFNLISALHKSLRNSDADAALYWLARMLESGEDPLYVARRMIRFASEDVGNADPGALRIALSARDAFVSLGMPEGALALAQAAIYLAATPKSNSVYEAYGRVIEELRRGGADPVPLALRNAPTALMRDLGYGRDYAYAHDEPEGTADLECLPDRLRGRRFYRPRPVGHERALGERLQDMENRRAKKATAAARTVPPPERTDE
jgi:putative ATPase